MNALEATKQWVLSRLGDGTEEIKYSFARQDLPIGASIDVVKFVVSGMVRDGSAGVGSDVVRTDNAGCLLHFVPPTKTA